MAAPDHTTEWMWVGVARTALPCALKPLWTFQSVFDTPTEGSIPIDTAVALYDGAQFKVDDPSDWPWVPASEGFVFGIHRGDWRVLKQHIRQMRCVVGTKGQLCAWPWFNPAYWLVLLRAPSKPALNFLGPVRQLVLADSHGCTRVDLETHVDKASGLPPYPVFDQLIELSVTHHIDRLWVWCARMQRERGVVYSRGSLEAWVRHCASLGVVSPYQQAARLVCALWCGLPPSNDLPQGSVAWLDQALDLGLPLAILRDLHAEFASQLDHRQPFAQYQRDADFIGLTGAQRLSLKDSPFLGKDGTVFVPCGNEVLLQQLESDFLKLDGKAENLKDLGRQHPVLTKNGDCFGVTSKHELLTLLIQKARQWPPPARLGLRKNPVLDEWVIASGGQRFQLFDAHQKTLGIDFNAPELNWHVEYTPMPNRISKALPHAFEASCDWVASNQHTIVGELSVCWHWQCVPQVGLQFHMRMHGELELSSPPVLGMLLGRLNDQVFELAVGSSSPQSWVFDEQLRASGDALCSTETLLSAGTAWSLTATLQAVQSVGGHRLVLADAKPGQLGLECLVQLDPQTLCVKPVLRLSMSAMNASLIASHPVFGIRHVNLEFSQACTVAQWGLLDG